MVEVLNGLVELLHREIRQELLKMAKAHPCLIQIFRRLAVLNGFRPLHKAVNTEDILVIIPVIVPAVFGRH